MPARRSAGSRVPDLTNESVDTAHLALVRQAAFLRPARPEDATAIATLFDLAGSGIPSCLWASAAGPGETPYAVGASRAHRPDANYSYRNATVAELHGVVIGMSLAYRLADGDQDRPKDTSEGPDWLAPILDLERLVSGSFYINALAVDEQSRRVGLGSLLLEKTIAEARDSGCSLVSLQCFSRNKTAMAFYRRRGFRVKAERRLSGVPGFTDSDRSILMARSVT